MQDHGFSLLEMLIVLLIFGIILSFATPSYQSHVIRMHRLEGQLALVELATHMEQYFGQYGTYTAATIGNQSNHDVMPTGPMTSQGYYKLVIRQANDSYYAIEAIPQNAQAHSDLRCQTLQFNAHGTQSIGPGPGGTPKGAAEECWS